MNELIFELIYPFLNFPSFSLLRNTSKSMQSLSNKPYYWHILNFTNFKHIHKEDLDELYTISDFLHIVNISKKNNGIYSFPKSLMQKVSDINIIII